MKPVQQTRFGPPDGNCMSACVASIIECKIEEVDIPLPKNGRMEVFMWQISEKIKKGICSFNYKIKLPSNPIYCMVSVIDKSSCSIINGVRQNDGIDHMVVGFIGDNNILSIKYDPKHPIKHYNPSELQYPLSQYVEISDTVWWINTLS